MLELLPIGRDIDGAEHRRIDPERLARKLAVEGLVILRRGLEVTLHLVGTAARHVRARCPIGAGGAHIRIARARRHRLERGARDGAIARSEEHTSELQSLMRISYAV